MNDATAQQFLNVLEKISEQQIGISAQLAELLEHLNTPQETSLIDQLSELLQPLFNDMQVIKQTLASTPNSPNDDAQRTT